MLPNKRLADSFFPPAKVNCYHLRQVIYQQQIGPCTSVFFPGNECCEPSPTREGETIKLLTQTELSGRIFYRLIIHVFSLTNCYIRNVLHSAADLRRTRNAAYSPKKEKKRAFVCMLTILPCQQRDNEYSSIAGRNSDVTDMSHAALLQIHKLLFAQHQHSAWNIHWLHCGSTLLYIMDSEGQCHIYSMYPHARVRWRGRGCCPTPLDILKESTGQIPAAFMATKSGVLSQDVIFL